ncbi:SLC13 family permease [Bizionia myxarmorum]|uniref:DASS family sodium-coupled anion symporter n=1 Tax=Bizionia myxarmorum TaxID=291186 RepID=A0A5D0R4R9_9FLAO|nr:DASS family sodium-coupled anion symporter [Bizionia myxarmorum]TYB75861.1 DASS family sodium-coupled anion symporter [Bizionia myxarmorum]
MKEKQNWKALTISILLLIGILVFPLFEDADVNSALAILIFAASLWISEAIPLALTALLIPVMAVVLNIATPKLAFSEFSNPVIYLFMGGFVLAGALSTHALDRLLAHKLMRLSKGNFYKSAILLMLATSLTACWVSNTSTAAMMIPLALGMLAITDSKNATAEAKFLLLGIAYAANIGGIVTMIASPPNAIGATLLNLTFSEWLMYGVPIFLITFPIMVVVLTIYFKPNRHMLIATVALPGERSTKRTVLLGIFAITILLWVFEGLLSPLLNISSGFSSLVAIVAILMLFTFKVLTWKQILEAIRWDILLLFGGGLTLGLLVENTGLGTILVSGVMDMSKQVPLVVFIWLIVFGSIVLTEFMSNTASAALILPLLYTLAQEAEINPMILVLPATIAASFGFMMPVGTPPNAMVYSTGFVPQREMMKAGLGLNFIFSIVLTLFFYIVFR